MYWRWLYLLVNLSVSPIANITIPLMSTTIVLTRNSNWSTKTRDCEQRETLIFHLVLYLWLLSFLSYGLS